MNIITVGFNSEQFKCDGKSDSATIQSALDKLDYGDTISFSKGTYEIDDPVNFPKINFRMTGDTDSSYNPLAKIKLKSECGWTNKSLAVSTMFVGANSKDVEIDHIELDLNSANQTYISKNYDYQYVWGRGFHNGFYFVRGNNIKIHDCYIHHALNDGVRFLYGSNYYFYNNKVYLAGHEACFFDGNPYGIDSCYAYGNNIVIRADSSIRASDATNVDIYDNIVDCNGNGNPGLSVGDNNGLTTNVKIHNNKVSNSPGPGIWFNGSATKKKAIEVYDNVFSGCGYHKTIGYGAGTYITGFVGTQFRGNTFDGCYNAGILIDGTADDITIENNTFKNTKKTLAQGDCYHSWTGRALVNVSKCDVTVKDNSFSNNANGNYYGTFTKEDSDPCLVYVIGSKSKILDISNSISQKYTLFKRET